MKRVGLLKPDTIIQLINIIGVPFAALYAFSMIVWPWLAGHGSWGHVQGVWDRWQSLNVGILAFISSVIAFNIARYNNDRQRAREFLAAKALLPATLSNLSDYFSASAKLFLNAWHANAGTIPSLAVPSLPYEYQSVFANCIRHADPEVGEYLARILARTQIHDSRMRNFAQTFNSPNYVSPNKHNLISYLFRLCELQAMIDKQFDFARGICEFNQSPLQWSDFQNSFSVLDISPREIEIDATMNLEAFTRRRIRSGLEFREQYSD